jgi:hypothetical protein
LDLATEIPAGLADGTLPALRPGRVWITDSGRAKLLDRESDPGRAEDVHEPVKDSPDDAGPTPLAAVQALLHEVAARRLMQRRQVPIGAFRHRFP